MALFCGKLSDTTTYLHTSSIEKMLIETTAADVQARYARVEDLEVGLPRPPEALKATLTNRYRCEIYTNYA